MKSKAGFFLLIFLFMNLISCKEEKGYESSSFFDFGTKGMNENTYYSFRPDSVFGNERLPRECDVILTVRYTQDYEGESLLLNYEETSQSMDSILNGNLRLDLFPSSGYSVSHNMFPIHELDTVIFRKVMVTDDFEISLFTPQEDSRGIKSIGVTFIESD